MKTNHAEAENLRQLNPYGETQVIALSSPSRDRCANQFQDRNQLSTNRRANQQSIGQLTNLCTSIYRKDQREGKQLKLSM